MHINKLKILMVGPTGSGKTLIANFISESINIDELESTRPTQGVRIVEFELSDLNVNGKTTNVDIELWDSSGDHRFESCWPALRQGAQGVILVCSPSTANAATREMELLYNYYVTQPKLSTKQCLILYNCTEDTETLNLSPTFASVSSECKLKNWRKSLENRFYQFRNFSVAFNKSLLKQMSVFLNLTLLSPTKHLQEVAIGKFVYHAFESSETK